MGAIRPRIETSDGRFIDLGSGNTTTGFGTSNNTTVNPFTGLPQNTRPQLEIRNSDGTPLNLGTINNPNAPVLQLRDSNGNLLNLRDLGTTNSPFTPGINPGAGTQPIQPFGRANPPTLVNPGTGIPITPTNPFGLPTNRFDPQNPFGINTQPIAPVPSNIGNTNPFEVIQPNAPARSNTESVDPFEVTSPNTPAADVPGGAEYPFDFTGPIPPGGTRLPAVPYDEDPLPLSAIDGAVASGAISPPAPNQNGRVKVDDKILRWGICRLYASVEGGMGGLFATIAGVVAIIFAVVGAFKAAWGFLLVAVGSFILRALVSLFYDVDAVTPCQSQIQDGMSVQSNAAAAREAAAEARRAASQP